MGGGDRQNLMSVDLGRSGPDLGPGPGPELNKRARVKFSVSLLCKNK